MATPAIAGLSALLDTARQQWIHGLIDVGGTNTLLYFKPTKASLDLEGADARALNQLLAGHELDASDLFPTEPEPRAEAVDRARRIHGRIRAGQEEKGVHLGYLALGMATWTDPQDGRKVPMAPVLLRAAHVNAAPGQRRYSIRLDEEYEVNETLLFFLTRQLGVHLPESALSGFDLEEASSNLEAALGAVSAALTSATRPVLPDFAVDLNRKVLGLFNYRTLPMVRDLEANGALMAQNAVIRAMAGDASARAELTNPNNEVSPNAPDHVAPEDEFLVVDADASQNYVINAIAAGQSIVIDGPPGTGKSQTIVNLITVLMARGKRVLFVAEKRAAIDAVLERLDRVGLRDFVMDLHDGAPTKRYAMEVLSRATDALSDQTHFAPLSEPSFTTNRDRLVRHHEMVHCKRKPWDLSVFELQQGIARCPEPARLALRWPEQILQHLHGARLGDVTEQLDQFTQLGGVRTRPDHSPWCGARITTPAEAERAVDAARDLDQSVLPELRGLFADAAAELGLPAPHTPRQCHDLLALLDRTAELARRLRPDVYNAPLPELLAATGTRRWRKEHGSTLAYGRRRALKKSAATLATAPGRRSAELHDDVAKAMQLAWDWQAVGGNSGPPRTPAAHQALRASLNRWVEGVRVLTTVVTPPVDYLNGDFPQIQQSVRTLATEIDYAQRLPHLHAALVRLQAAGLGPFIDELRRQRIPDDQVRHAFEFCYLSSILERLRFTDTTLSGFDGAGLHRTVRIFHRAETEHFGSAAQRVRVRLRGGYVQMARRHDDQHTLIKREAAKRKRIIQIRDLLRLAPDVALAAAPCWAMSPLMVSQLLPPRQLFDVVVFDEASQIRPAEAVTSMMRGRQVAVAGDPRQLPPTAFFAKFADEDDDDVEDEEELAAAGNLAVTVDHESILDALTVLLPRRQLTWHYRSADERLIAFSNEHVYGRSLTTFPSTAEEPPLNFVQVTERGEGAIDSRSNSFEVDRVVQLVLDHARARPTRSLGVIAMGIAHANRIDEAVRKVAQTDSALDDFFADNRRERFFVKSIESVQGDERDCVILSVGYAKRPDGRMRYYFGPLNREGGERRLNVAVTRARHNVTVVCSFTAADMDPSRLAGAGPQLLRKYLQFAESGGRILGDGPVPGVKLNPFELDVERRLTEAGIPLLPQYGVGGYRIDFAARHPKQPGRFVLAIEADGASYHSSATARDRDRLRQQHLEHLGWRFHRIWSTDWFRDPLDEVARAKAAYEAATVEVDQAKIEAHPAPEPDTASQMTVPISAAPSPQRDNSRPRLLHPGTPIDQYITQTLIQLVGWIESDGVIRTVDEVVRAASAELGYARLGSKIRIRLEQAVSAQRNGRRLR